MLAASPGTNPFTEATTRFIFDDGKIESLQARGELPASYFPSTIFYQFCLPPGDSETNTVASGSLVVAADGKMTGDCQASRTSTDGSGSSIVAAKRGTLTGQYDLAAQTVTFHFEGSSEYTYIQPPTCKGDRCGPVTAVLGVVVDGPVTGGEVIGDTARGTARHTFTCSPEPQCPVTKQVATSSFLIQFLPALPSAEPAAGGGGSTGGGSGDGGSSPVGDDGFGLDPLVLLLILAALVLVLLLLRLAIRRPGSMTPAEFKAALGTSESVLQTAEQLADPTPTATAPGTPSPGDGSAPAKVEEVVDFGAGMIGSDEAPPTPPAPASAATPAGSPSQPPPPKPPPTSDPGDAVQKPPELVMTENIVLAAELADPEQPPPNPATIEAPPGPARMGGPLAAMTEQAIRGSTSPIFRPDASGGFEGETSYGDATSTASAASGAYEAEVVASGQQGTDDPLAKPPGSKDEEAERDRERDGEDEGR